jgi:hypothetical protein
MPTAEQLPANGVSARRSPWPGLSPVPKLLFLKYDPITMLQQKILKYV